MNFTQQLEHSILKSKETPIKSKSKEILSIEDIASILLKEVPEKDEEVICLFDLQGKILLINNQGKKYLHGSPDENNSYYIQENIISLSAKEDYDIYISILLDEKIFKDVVKVTNNKGKERILEFEVELRELENFSYIYGKAKDVTSTWRRRIDKGIYLGYSNKRLNNSRSNIFVFNKDLTICDVNRTAIASYNLKKNDVLGSSVQSFCELIEVDFSKFSNAIKEAFNEGSRSTDRPSSRRRSWPSPMSCSATMCSRPTATRTAKCWPVRWSRPSSPCAPAIRAS